MDFTWNRLKAMGKHGVSFPEAMTVFGDPLSFITDCS